MEETQVQGQETAPIESETNGIEVETNGIDSDGLNDLLTFPGLEEQAQGEGGVAKEDARQEEAKEESVEAPTFWSQGDKEEFKKLPESVQHIVAKYAKESDRAASIAIQERGEALNREAHLLNYAQTELANALQEAQYAIHGDFANINFARLKVNDPQLYTQTEGIYEQRLAAIESAKQQLLQIQAIEQQRSSYLAREEMKQEAANVKSEIMGMLPEGTTSESYKSGLKNYLIKEGVSEDIANNGLTKAWHLRIVTKAMLYDNLMKNKSLVNNKINKAQPVIKGTTSPVTSPRGGKDDFSDLLTL